MNHNHTNDLCDDGTGYAEECDCDTNATVTYTSPDGFVHPDKVCPFCFDQLTTFDARLARGMVVA